MADYKASVAEMGNLMLRVMVEQLDVPSARPGGAHVLACVAFAPDTDMDVVRMGIHALCAAHAGCMPEVVWQMDPAHVARAFDALVTDTCVVAGEWQTPHEIHISYMRNGEALAGYALEIEPGTSPTDAEIREGARRLLIKLFRFAVENELDMFDVDEALEQVCVRIADGAPEGL